MANAKEKFGRLGYKTAVTPFNGIYTIKDGCSEFHPQLTELYDKMKGLDQFFSSRFVDSSEKEKLETMDALEYYSDELEWPSKRLYIRGEFDSNSDGSHIQDYRSNSDGKVIGEFRSLGRLGTTAYKVREYDTVL